MNKHNPEVPFSLDRIIKGMPEHAYVFSKEGKLLAWNKNVENLLEYSEHEMKNKFVSEFVYKNDKERVVEKFMEILAEGENKERIIEYYLQTKTGKIIPCLAMRSLVIIDGIQYIVGILINISEFKNNKAKLNTYINQINQVKNQLQDYYLKIEKINQNEINLKEYISLSAKYFNNKLINSLPGIFCLCEKVGEQFFIKRWNKNFETKLGYTSEELLNIQLFQTFDNKKEYGKVEKAIKQIFITGNANVTAIWNTKSGKTIPYLFEGYLLEEAGKVYLMWVGVDISKQIAIEKKQKQQKLEKRKAKEKHEANKRELIATALKISSGNEIIEYTVKKIDKLLGIKDDQVFRNDLLNIRKYLNAHSSEQDNWEVFRLHFREVHKKFFKKLKEKHPSLTKSELKFCAYLRIRLSSSQIASALNVTKEAVKKTRYRIRKKIGMLTKDSLEDYIAKF